MPDDQKANRTRDAGRWLRVADEQQENILFGQLQPNQHLIEEEIMQQSGASRHAVRRAFEELERRGLVQRLPNRGARVRGYSPQEVRDLYEMRETIETEAALRIPLPVPAAVIARLEEIERRHEQASQSRDIHELFSTNNEFHDVLYGCCSNAIFAEAIRAYAWRTHPIRMRFMTKKDQYMRAVEQHWRVIRLLSGNDNQALAQLCFDHLQPSKRFYLSIYDMSPLIDDTVTH